MSGTSWHIETAEQLQLLAKWGKLEAFAELVRDPDQEIGRSTRSSTLEVVKRHFQKVLDKIAVDAGLQSRAYLYDVDKHSCKTAKGPDISPQKRTKRAAKQQPYCRMRILQSNDPAFYEYLHRIVLWARCGPPPSAAKYQACHCKPDGVVCPSSYCINPYHLRWDTPKANAADRKNRRMAAANSPSSVKQAGTASRTQPSTVPDQQVHTPIASNQQGSMQSNQAQEQTVPSSMKNKSKKRKQPRCGVVAVRMFQLTD